MFDKLLKYGNILFLIGQICFLISSLFRNSLSDFMKGYFEGIAVALMLYGAILMVIKAVRKRQAK